MYVHIHRLRIHGDMQYAQWKLMLHQILLVAFLDSLGDHTAADKTTVDKIDLEVTVGTHQYRFAQISFDFDAVLFDLDRHQLCGDLPAVDPVNYLPQVTVSGGMESGLVSQYEFKRNIRSRQRQMFHQIRDITALCGRLF